MRPTRRAGSEDHRLARSTQNREPPTSTDPAPASDEAISDPGRQHTWGKPLGKKQQNHIRICFQNVGGIIPAADDDLKLTVLRQFTQQHNIDVFGFAEHNVCWDVIQKTQQLAERTKGWWENAHWTTAFNQQDKNPTAHQPGGTGVLTVNQLSHRVMHSGGDASGLGRWSWVRLRGKEGASVRIISAYRPCFSSGRTQHTNSM